MANVQDAASQGSLNETVFTAVYEWSASKTLNIVLSISSIFLITPWLLYIIWYERYGANHRRTLINVEGVTLVLPSRLFMFNEYWRILALS